MLEAEVRAALALHPATRQLAAGPLTVVPGGLSNYAWHTEYEGQRYFVRLGAPEAERMGVDRRSECMLLATVAAAGLAPAVVACEPASRLLVTRFIAGRHWQREETRDPRNLRRMGQSLRQLHSLPLEPGIRPLSFAAQAAQLEAQLAAFDSGDARVKGAAAQAIADLAQRNEPATLCHNDLHHLNVLDDGNRLWLVDWEYGGCGDPLLDLAGFFCQHDATPDECRIMLESYGEPSLAGSRSLLAACRLFDYVQWLWFRLWIATHAGAAGEYAQRAEALAARLVR